MGCLYQLTFPNGKSYIGISASTADARFTIHRYHMTLRRKQTLPLYRALKKYGPASVQVKTLCLNDDWQMLCDLERDAINKFCTRIPNGYNLTDGGEGTIGWSPTAEQLSRMSAWQVGRKLSEEHKQKVSKSLIGNSRKLGKKESIETRLRKSIAYKNRWPEMNADERARRLTPMRAFSHCPKRAAKISQAKIGVYSGGASGHVGIQFVERMSQWRARVKLNQKAIHLGYFAKLEDAISARLKFIEST